MLLRASSVIFVERRGEHDNGDAGSKRGIKLIKMIKKLKSVHLRHHDIEDDNEAIRIGICCQPVKGCLTSADFCNSALGVRLSDHHAGNQPVDVAVVDDQKLSRFELRHLEILNNFNRI